MTTETIKGLRELGESMRLMSSEVSTKIGRRATGKAANLIKKAAVANIERSPSIDTRSLHDAVIVKRLGKRDSDLTSEHIVTVRRRKAKKAKGKQATAPHAGHVEFGTVNMPAEPYLRPAFDGKARAAVDVMAQELRDGIAKAAKGSSS